jgi:hypothetical protein|tara:strand:+ start:858 stop:1028 length:171 start_codon:yes stop_codon:yes gene_type:complete
MSKGVESRKKLIAKLGHAICEMDANASPESRRAVKVLTEQIKRTNIAYGFDEFSLN